MKSQKNKSKKVIGPEITNMDVLALMSDEELDNLEKRLNTEREVCLLNNTDVVLWEEELCYVQREREIRNIRKVRHGEWYAEFRKQFEYIADDILVN